MIISKVRFLARITLITLFLSVSTQSTKASDKKLIGAAVVAVGCCLYKWFSAYPRLEEVVIPKIKYAGRHVDAKNQYGRTRVMQSALDGNYDRFVELVKDSKLDLVDINGRTLLINAVIGQNPDIVSIVLNLCPESIDVQDDSVGMTALMYAVVYSNIDCSSGSYLTKYGFEIIKLLCEHGANDELEDSTDGGRRLLKSNWTYIVHGRTVYDFIDNQFGCYDLKKYRRMVESCVRKTKKNNKPKFMFHILSEAFLNCASAG